MTSRSHRRASTTKAATFHTSAYDLLAAGDLEGENVRFAYIGGPTALIEIGEWRLLTDPTFDPPGKRYFMEWGPMSRKVQGPALTVDRLGKVDAVLVSHDHHSEQPRGRRPRAAVGDRNGHQADGWAWRLGAGTRGLAPWATTGLEAPGKPTLEITATPCRHGFPSSKPIVGDVIGFALTWGGQTNGQVLLSGDTVLHLGVREVAGAGSTSAPRSSTSAASHSGGSPGRSATR